MSPRPILIVDDDIDHAVILRTVLASVVPDASTATCTDPSRLPEALLEAERGAVVFMDRLLRGVESISYLETAATHRPDLDVVLLSSALSEDDRARALEAGAFEAAEKPGSIAGWRSFLVDVLGLDTEGATRAG